MGDDKGGNIRGAIKEDTRSLDYGSCSFFHSLPGIRGQLGQAS